MNRPAATAFLALLAAGPALAATPASTLPLPPPAATPIDQPLQRQTGMVVIDGPHGERTIIRSVEPRSLVGGDKLDFAVLDADGDGRVSRAEAAVDRSLQLEFGNVDVNGDRFLDRGELAGWIL